MSIQDLGAIGEFASSVIVLITLVYIAIQSRENKAIAAAASIREIFANHSEIYREFRAKENLQLLRKGLSNWEDLDKDEQAQLHIFFMEVVTHYGNVLQQKDLPGMEDWIQVFENNAVGMLLTSGGSTWWEIMRPAYNEEVAKRLDERLADTESLPPSWSQYMPWYSADESEDGA